jgi:outer membrane murein-binding lipoprotein Lpp
VSTWSTVALSLGSAAIGATAALAGTGLQLRRARLDRERADRAAWRDRAANVLGPILGVLDDMEPRAIAEHGGRSQQTIENIGRRWWRGRDDLLVFGVANPSREIASASQALAADVARLWTSMTSLNRALQAAGGSGGQVDAELLDRACSDHELATSAAQALEELSRE